MKSNVFIKYYDIEKKPTINEIIHLNFPKSIRNLKQTLEFLEQKIGYPKASLSSGSLDAVLDILSCNYFGKENYKNIFFVHNNLPSIPQEELAKYINLLNTSIYKGSEDYYKRYSNWAKDHCFKKEEYIFDVFFPSKYKKIIEQFIPNDVISW